MRVLLIVAGLWLAIANAFAQGGLATRAENNGSDFASKSATAANIGVMPMTQFGGLGDYTSITPSFAKQLAVMNTGGGQYYFLIANSTTTGDWKGAPAFPFGVANIGSSSFMDPALCGSTISVDFNGSPTNGWNAPSDAYLVIRQWSTNDNNSGSGVGMAVMGIDAQGRAVVVDQVGLAFLHVLTNRIATLIPGWGMDVWNMSTSMKGMAIASTGIGADSGNYSLAQFDGKRKLFSIPFWQSGIYQPDDTSYLFTVSGVTVTPSFGACYTNNSSRFTVTATSIAAGSGTIKGTTEGGAPGASGTLTKRSGTGDATISFSASAVSAQWKDALVADPTTGSVAMTNGLVLVSNVTASVNSTVALLGTTIVGTGGTANTGNISGGKLQLNTGVTAYDVCSGQLHFATGAAFAGSGSGFNSDGTLSIGFCQTTVKTNMVWDQFTSTTWTSTGMRIGLTNATPAAGVILDLDTATKALLLPRMTKTQRNAITGQVAGMAVYQTDNVPGLRVYNGVNWMRYTETAD